VSLEALFQLCEKMIEIEKLESIELGIEAVGIIYHSIDEIHEKYFVNTVELFQKYFDIQPAPGRSQLQVGRLKEAIICAFGKMIYVTSFLTKNCCCINPNMRCQARWMDSWLEGLPLRYSTKELKEQVDILLSILDTGKDACISKHGLT